MDCEVITGGKGSVRSLIRSGDGGTRHLFIHLDADGEHELFLRSACYVLFEHKGSVGSR